ncbi:hypothetical protein KS4_23010 [Poriferisphaera corsica]|uniref:Uncharacterized protein n=1 Tax=Poriferisphaera corsica TaxID=2528020 RepID=A0A517YVJ7_9BACT|nr:hypothetical protein KS4_23010 [Poriferisphaera corsica]
MSLRLLRLRVFGVRGVVLWILWGASLRRWKLCYYIGLYANEKFFTILCRYEKSKNWGAVLGFIGYAKGLLGVGKCLFY